MKCVQYGSEAIVKLSVTVIGVRGLQMQCNDKKQIQRAPSLFIAGPARPTEASHIAAGGSPPLPSPHPL